MRAENCGRYGAEVRGEHLTYDNIERRFVCDVCRGGVTHRVVWNDAKKYNEDRVACARCGSDQIILESTYDKQISDAMELESTGMYKREMKEAGMPLKDVKREGRLKRVETIRLGWTEETPNSDWDKVVASDHFVFTDAPTLAEIYPEPVKSLPVYFAYRTFDDNVSASYSVWVGGRKDRDGKHRGGFTVCRGDGECVQSALPFKVSHKRNGSVSVQRAPGPRLVSWGKAAVDFKWGEHEFKEGEQVACPGKNRDLYPHCEACRPSILIKIRIRGDPRVARFGYWQISTQSLNNYKHLMSVWDELTLLPDGSRIPLPMNEMPFILSIAPGATLYQNQKDQMWGTREAFFLQLEPEPDVVKLLDAYRDQRFVRLLRGEPDNIPRLVADVEEGAYLSPEEEELPFDEPPIEEGEFESVEPPTATEPATSQPPHRKARGRSFKADQIQALIKSKAAENPHEASAMLNLSDLVTPEDSVPRIVAWAALYRAQRDQDVEPAAAAQAADKMLKD